MTTEEVCAKVIGKSEERASGIAEAEGHILRVMRRDGRNQIGTCELRPNRLNVAVTDGIVTEVIDCG